MKVPRISLWLTIVAILLALYMNEKHQLASRLYCWASQVPTSELIEYQVLATFPHNRKAYTQGLYFDDGFIYEGTGQYGQSELRKVMLESGEILQHAVLQKKYFGEGIATLKDRIYQLSWKSGHGFIYDKDSFKPLGQFRYPGEGWGLTQNGKQLIMSNGSNVIYFRDPQSLREVRNIQVCDSSGPVDKLNELEYIQGDIYANVWLTNRIVRISTDTGHVLGEIDLSTLADDLQLTNPTSRLNGIAYDVQQDRAFVTGKRWPKLFAIKMYLNNQ